MRGLIFILSFILALGVNSCGLIFAQDMGEISQGRDIADVKTVSEENDSAQSSASSPPDGESLVTVPGEPEKVYLDFRDADIRDVAKVFEKVSGRSILVTPNVKEKVTLSIEGLPWPKALEVILRTCNLSRVESDDVIIIGTYKDLQQYQVQIPLKTKLITLNFLDIAKAQGYISTISTGRGSIAIDKRTNTMIVTDTPDAIQEIESVIKKLDMPTPQVLIEVLMVDKKVSEYFDFGITWTFTDKDDTRRSVAQSWAVDASAIVFNYGKSVFSHAWLAGMMRLYENENKVDVIATPKILTLDNTQATIDITEQIEYTETTTTDQGHVTTTSFKNAGVKINVKPHVTFDEHIILDISTDQKLQGGELNNNPIIDGRSTKTTLMVKDGETIVISGLRQMDHTNDVIKVPILGDLPMIGGLFRRIDNDEIVRELLVFVTPSIVRGSKKPVTVQKRADRFGKETVYNKNIEAVSRGLLPKGNLDEPVRKVNVPGVGEAASEYKKSFAYDAQRKKEVTARLRSEDLGIESSGDVSAKPLESRQDKEFITSESEFGGPVLPDFGYLELLPAKGPDRKAQKGEISAYKLYQNGRNAKAIDKYRQLLKLNPDNPKIHYNLGIIYALDGSNHLAVKEFQKAAKSVDPKILKDTFYNLALIYGKHLQDIGKAYAYYQKFKELEE